MKKHIAPLTDETHNRAWGIRISCKAKNWDETINKLIDSYQELQKIKEDSVVELDSPQDLNSQWENKDE